MSVISTPTTMDRFGQALIDLLNARSGLVDVIVTDGIPAPGKFDAREWIAILDIEFEVQARQLNRTTQPREERYVQNVLISVTQATRDAQATANSRVWELYSELEDAIRDDPTLSTVWTGDGQIVSVLVDTGRFSKRVNDAATEREAAIEVGLAVHSRI